LRIVLFTKKKTLYHKAGILYKHHLFTVSFISLLKEINYFSEIKGYQNLHEAHHLIRDNDINHLFIEYNFPGNDIFSFIRNTAESNPELYIIVVSSYESDNLVSRIQQAGAHAFISKKSGKKEVKDCLQVIGGGNYYISPEIINSALRVHINRKEEVFTEKELEILHHISAGKTIKEISIIMNTSPYTTTTHRRNMMKKINAPNTAVLVKKAIKLGLL